MTQEEQKHPILNHIHPGSKSLRYFFFVAGIVATIAYRITPFLNPLFSNCKFQISNSA